MTHHTNLCKKTDGTTCKQCTKHHHYSLHNNRRNSDGNAHFNQQFDASKLEAGKINIETSSKPTIKTQNNNVQEYNKIKGVCPIQTVRIRNKNGEFVEILPMIDSGSNVSLMSKSTAKQLGLEKPELHMTMNLAGGKQKSETSQQIEIFLAPINDDHIIKTMNVLTVQKPCSAAKSISKTVVENYSHLKSVTDNLHLEGGSTDLLIGIDFPSAFKGEHQEPMVGIFLVWSAVKMIIMFQKLSQSMWVP